MASLQLPAKYPQLPALLIGPTETLIWPILAAYFSPLHSPPLATPYHSPFPLTVIMSFRIKVPSLQVRILLPAETLLLGLQV